jgi:hypothetical protein
MKHQKWFIILWVNNFSGHTTGYKPTNIRLEFFSPNLTLYVQPCDAGIIRCLKAHYRCSLAIRAVYLYEINDSSPFKIDLSAIRLLGAAWSQVTQTTIANCWKHTGVCPVESDEWEDIFVDPNTPDSDDSDDVQMLPAADSKSSPPSNTAPRVTFSVHGMLSWTL